MKIVLTLLVAMGLFICFDHMMMSVQAQDCERGKLECPVRFWIWDIAR